MKVDKYITNGDSEWDVRDCAICRKPTLQQLIDGKWKCTEHPKSKKRRRETDIPEPASQEEIDKVNEEWRVRQFKKTLKIIRKEI